MRERRQLGFARNAEGIFSSPGVYYLFQNSTKRQIEECKRGGGQIKGF